MRTLRFPLGFLGPVISSCLVLATGLAVAGEPKTPLGKWMKANLGAQMAGQDFGALKASFDTVAAKAPAKTPTSDYANWSAIGKKGSVAAAAQDVAGVKAACKGCHDSYKQAYVADYRTTPFP